jgi:hypothetical protein
MNERRWNWPLWAGFLLSVFAFLSYFALFVKFPVTRDIPWVSFLLFGIAVILLGLGLKRAFGQSQLYRGKIFGSILSVVSLLIVTFFCLLIFKLSKQLPASAAAPHIGAKAPDFELPDTQGKTVSLNNLLTAPIPSTHVVPKGVLLVFYRGYW